MTTPRYSDAEKTRQAIIDACLWMGQNGVNSGTSGNISIRVPGGCLITPSAIPYAQMTPDMIVRLPVDGSAHPGQGYKPSTEWRFHQAILAARPDVDVVVHAHPTYATAIAAQRRPIPAVHYMVAAFGGPDVPVTDYAIYGGVRLSDLVTEALKDRDGCLMANHGAITLGDTLERALWRMQELENLAKVYAIASSTGTPVLLTDAEIAEVKLSFADYGAK